MKAVKIQMFSKEKKIRTRTFSNATDENNNAKVGYVRAFTRNVQAGIENMQVKVEIIRVDV